MTAKKDIPTKTHREMIDSWRTDPEFRTAYDELETEYALLRDLLDSRRRAGLTQADVASRMGTQPTAITRLERALSENRHSPTVATLKKYAAAVGCRLEIRLVPEGP